MDNAPEYLKFVVQNAKEMLIRDGCHSPMAFLFMRNKSVKLMALDFCDQDAKIASLSIISDMLKTGRYESCVMASEAWMIKRKPEEVNPNGLLKDGKKPSQCDDRMDILNISYHDEKGGTWLCVVEFKKTKQGIKILKEDYVKSDNQTKFGGRLYDFWR